MAGATRAHSARPQITPCQAVEVQRAYDWSGWLLVLLGSLALWQAALWLHNHPSSVVSLFDAWAPLAAPDDTTNVLD